MSDVSGPCDNFFKTLPIFQGAFAAIVTFEFYVKGAVTSITGEPIVTAQGYAVIDIVCLFRVMGFVVKVVGFERFPTPTDLTTPVAPSDTNAPAS